jgi:hypothetical protein
LEAELTKKYGCMYSSKRATSLLNSGASWWFSLFSFLISLLTAKICSSSLLSCSRNLVGSFLLQASVEYNRPEIYWN